MKPTNNGKKLTNEAFFFELSSDLLAISTQDAQFLRVNRTWEKLLGYPLETILQGKYIEFVHPDDVQETERALQGIIDSRQISGFVNRYRKSDGTYVFLEWSADIHNDLVYSIARDVTGLKQTEAKLQENIEKLTELSDFQEVLFHSITDIIGVQDLQHNVLMYNQAGYDFLGKSPEEVKGKKCFHLIGNEHPCQECATSCLYATGKPARVERYFESLDKWLDVRAYPVYNQEGKLWRIIEHIRDITEIKKSQLELLENKEYFIAVIDSINDAVFVDDASTGEVIFVNQTAADMYGYSREELVSMNIEAISAGPPDYTQATAIGKLLLAKETGPQVFEWLARRSDGILFWVEVNARYAEIGKSAFFIVSVRDISTRKETEKALIQSEEKFRQLVSQAAEMLFLHDQQGKILEVNLNACRQTGYSREELLSMYVFDIDPDAMNRGDMLKFWQALKPGEVVSVEVRHQSKSGEIYPAEVSLGKIVMGEEENILALAKDISTRKNIERILIADKANLEAVIENTDDLIWSVDARLNLVFANKAFYSFYRHAFGHELNTGSCFATKRNASDYESRWFRICMEVIENGKRLTTEIETELEGSRFYFEFELNPIKDNNNDVTGIAISGRNISPHKERETIFRISNEELKKANAEKDQLMSIIAHDLRSPFTTFLGFTEMLLDPDFMIDESKTKEIFIMLRKSALSTYRLIENLLEWTRIQRGVLKPEMIYTSFEDIVDNAISSLSEVAANKQVIIEKECMRNRYILADSHMMETVMRNLLSNAIKFSYRNSKVVIQCLQEGNKIRIMVMDFGTGMSEETLTTLFRVDPSKGMSGTEGERSSGLGLLICKELVGLHQGKIKVVSRLGKGSTFIVELPLPELESSKITDTIHE